MNTYSGSRGIATLALHLGTRWRRVVNFTPPSLYPWKEPQYPLNKGLGEPQSWCERGGDKQNYVPVQEFPPQTIQPLA